MLVGYSRISKSDGSQTLDLQTDALIKEGIKEDVGIIELVRKR